MNNFIKLTLAGFFLLVIHPFLSARDTLPAITIKDYVVSFRDRVQRKT